MSPHATQILVSQRLADLGSSVAGGSAAEHTSPLSGMIPMYLLMSAFHSPPWLELISSRRNGARRA
jgi:hypothetical protein